jgi:hypothetical protein
MTEKEFLRSVSNGGADIVQMLLDILHSAQADYCVIGGLAVNAYVEPVVSLDLDIVVATRNVEAICERAAGLGWRIERFPHSINLTSPASDLRIQLQVDGRYQEFIPRALRKSILGYEMQVAQLEDVVRGKVWACEDPARRKSKRQKDLADLARIVEAYPATAALLPDTLRKVVE